MLGRLFFKKKKKTGNIARTKHSTENTFSHSTPHFTSKWLRQVKTQRRERWLPERLLGARHLRSGISQMPFEDSIITLSYRWASLKAPADSVPDASLQGWGCQSWTQTLELPDLKTPVFFPVLASCFHFSPLLWRGQGKDCCSHSTWH